MLNVRPHSRISGVSFPAFPDAHAAMQLALQYQLEVSQWWTPEQLQAHQAIQLQALLAHAAATVPYYREMFADVKLNFSGGVLPQFRQIPISNRQAIQKAGEQINSTALALDHGGLEFSKTSGSTGRPVQFARTAVTRTFSLAFALREHLWHGRDFRGKLCAIRWFPRGAAEAPEGARDASWGPIVAPIFESGPAAMLNVVSTLPAQIAWLQRERPDYLLSFPSNLLALSRHARENSIKLPPLREVRTIGETLSDTARQLIAATWQAPVVDLYSCEEAGYLAVQCPEAAHYHVQTENVLLEIVDEAGQPCPPGEVGRVLITTLHNFATPLIRYEVGDLAEFGVPCACGRGLPVIRKIHGRQRSRLILPSGESVFPYLGEHGEIAQTTGVELHQFQCIQHSLEDIELKLVMERPLNEAEQATVAKLMQQHLGYPFPIRCSFPGAIPRGPTGKFEEFVSLIAN